jgi:hypothetical protein
MTKSLLICFAVLVCSVSAFGQMGGPGGGGAADNSFEQLFNANPAFSATMQTRSSSGTNAPMYATAKMFFDHGNMRSDMNMADVQNSGYPPAAIAQLKAMGMDQVTILQPSSSTNVIILYPRLSSYFSIASPSQTTGDSKVQTTKLGQETVGGHPCIKNMQIVTMNGQPHEFTTWNATDLNNFPIQIAQTEEGASTIISFQNVSFGKVPASEFQAPAGYTQYGSPVELMQAAMMSHSSAMPGAPGASRGSAPNQ